MGKYQNYHLLTARSFRVDTEGSLPKDVNQSLSMDEVNNDPNELIDLRGEGRYFGRTDTVTGPICSNCHRRGHIRAKCKVVVCHACGAVDDHYETQCPKSMVCSNCGKKGHFKNQCSEKKARTFCTQCESKNHSDERCPSIWRSYLTVNSDEKKALPMDIYCYNCASRGHYGDECFEPRSSRTPNLNGSAYTGNNLPKELRQQYFTMLKKRAREDGDLYEQSLVTNHTPRAAPRPKMRDNDRRKPQKFQHQNSQPQKSQPQRSQKFQSNRPQPQNQQKNKMTNYQSVPPPRPSKSGTLGGEKPWKKRKKNTEPQPSKSGLLETSKKRNKNNNKKKESYKIKY